MRPFGRAKTFVICEEKEMGLIAEAKRIKEVHPNYIMLYKSGEFYKVFGKDAYIISDLCEYRIKIVNGNVATCGFPLSAIYKVRVKIEENSINYMLIDPRNNYEVDVKENFKNLNRYDKQFEKSYTVSKCKKKIKNIADRLNRLIGNPNFKEIVGKVDNILNETRKV